MQPLAQAIEIATQHVGGAAAAAGFTHLTEENFKAIEEKRSRYEKIVYDMILKGVRSGDFQVPDAKITSFALIAMLTGVVDWFREDGRLSSDELTRQYCALARQTLGVNAPA